MGRSNFNFRISYCFLQIVTHNYAGSVSQTPNLIGSLLGPVNEIVDVVEDAADIVLGTVAQIVS